MSLNGLEQVVANLNKEIKAIEGRSLAGLIRAAILVRRDMSPGSGSPPYIPFDLGYLEASWFTNPGYQANGNPFLTCGFSANYSVYVHELLGKSVNWKRPGSGPKFFQASLRRNTGRIIAVIKEEAQIK